MGMYTAISFRLKVRKNTPLPVIEFMDKFFYEGDTLEALKELQKELGVQIQSTAIALAGNEFGMNEVDNMAAMICQHSASFESWYWRVKEDKGDYWLYETRASCKRPDLELSAKLIQALLPCLIIEEGDVVLRSIYEDSDQERVLALVNGKIVKETGYTYNNDTGWSDPWDEKAPIDYVGGDFGPLIHTRITEEEEFTPPWTLQGIRAAKRKVEMEKEARIEEIRKEGGGFGFGGW